MDSIGLSGKIASLGKTVNVAMLTEKDAKLYQPIVHGDDRGFFLERYRQSDFEIPFVQENMSFSRKGIFRGLHFQLEKPQGKLVNCVQGEILDVFMDMRIGSPDFLSLQVVPLSEKNNHTLWVPPGFAHGFYVKSETAILQYRCTEYFDPELDSGVSVNSPEVYRVLKQVIPEIDDCLLSTKDRSLCRLMDYDLDLLETYKDA